jgi:hypothetical protein
MLDRIYIAVIWQLIDQIRYNMLLPSSELKRNLKQEINMKQAYRVHKRSPLDFILTHIVPVHILATDVRYTTFNNVLQFFSCLFPSSFQTIVLYKFCHLSREYHISSCLTSLPK